MNRFKKKKQEQRKATEEQTKRPPAGHHHDAEGQDYLSDAFFVDDQPPTSTSSSKRAADPPPSHVTSKKAKAANAAVKLQEGMNTPLSQDNVGLRMLKLMGYKEGHGIGKRADGIKEPVAVVKKTDRGGLGQAERQNEARQRQEEWAQARAELLEQRKEDFKAAMSNLFAERRVASNLTKAMKAIETLDLRAGRERSCLWWSGVEEEEAEEKESVREGGEQGEGRGEEESGLSMVIGAEAPTVPTQEEAAAPAQHGQGGGGAEEGEGEAEEVVDELELWQTLSAAEKLSVASAYLREGHYYCLYCGHQYYNAEELREECPGESEDDH